MCSSCATIGHAERKKESVIEELAIVAIRDHGPVMIMMLGLGFFTVRSYKRGAEGRNKRLTSRFRPPIWMAVTRLPGLHVAQVHLDCSKSEKTHHRRLNAKKLRGKYEDFAAKDFKEIRQKSEAILGFD